MRNPPSEEKSFPQSSTTMAWICADPTMALRVTRPWIYKISQTMPREEPRLAEERALQWPGSVKGGTTTTVHCVLPVHRSTRVL